MSVAPIAATFAGEIKAVIDRYRDQGITVSEVVGCLEINKFEVLSEAKDIIEGDEGG